MGVVEQSGLSADVPAGVPLIGWHNLVTTTNITSTTATEGFPITNVANPATHLKWVANRLGNSPDQPEYITLDLDAATDYIAVAKHNWGSQGFPISIELNDGSGFVEVIPPTTPADDAPIIYRIIPHSANSPPVSPPVSSLSIRIKIAVTGGSIEPQAAVIYAGELLVLERSIKIDAKHVPISYGRRSNIINGMSENGNFLGRIVIGAYLASKAEFEWFTPEFYRLNIDDFLEEAQHNPFFWAWSPEEYPEEVGFCWLTNNAEPEVDPVTRRVALELEMRGVA